MLNQRIHIAARHQPGDDDIVGHIQPAEETEEFVEHLPGPALEVLAFALLLDTVDHIGLFALHLLAEREQPCRIFLQVAIEQEDTFTAGMSQARHHGLVVAEVAREIDDYHVVIGFAQLDGQFQA
ncbi:hypothetical protein D3C78_1443250 [compost metagenome]